MCAGHWVTETGGGAGGGGEGGGTAGEINKKLTKGYYVTAGLITSCASINQIVNTMNRAGSWEKDQLSESMLANLVLF